MPLPRKPRRRRARGGRSGPRPISSTWRAVSFERVGRAAAAVVCVPRGSTSFARVEGGGREAGIQLEGLGDREHRVGLDAAARDRERRERGARGAEVVLAAASRDRLDGVKEVGCGPSPLAQASPSWLSRQWRRGRGSAAAQQIHARCAASRPAPWCVRRRKQASFACHRPCPLHLLTAPRRSSPTPGAAWLWWASSAAVERRGRCAVGVGTA